MADYILVLLIAYRPTIHLLVTFWLMQKNNV